MNFLKIATEEIESLYDSLESQGLEVDLIDDILYIYINKSTVYVINKHNVTRQLWLASPYSGAYKFSFSNGAWHNEKCSIRELLEKELAVKL